MFSSLQEAEINAKKNNGKEKVFNGKEGMKVESKGPNFIQSATGSVMQGFFRTKNLLQNLTERKKPLSTPWEDGTARIPFFETDSGSPKVEDSRISEFVTDVDSPRKSEEIWENILRGFRIEWAFFNLGNMFKFKSDETRIESRSLQPQLPRDGALGVIGMSVLQIISKIVGMINVLKRDEEVLPTKDIDTVVQASSAPAASSVLSGEAQLLSYFPSVAMGSQQLLSYFPSVGNITFMGNMSFMGNLSFPAISLPSFPFNVDNSVDSSQSNLTNAGMFSREIYRGFSSQAPMAYDTSAEEVLPQLEGSQVYQRTTPLPEGLVGITVNENFAVKLGRSEDLRSRPSFMYSDRSLLPTKADFSLLRMRRIEAAVDAAQAIKTGSDAVEFMKDIGIEPLVKAVTDTPIDGHQDLKVKGVKGICRLIKVRNVIADEIVLNDDFISVLIEAIEAPYRGFKSFKTSTGKEMELKMQRNALALIQRIIRSSDIAVSELIINERLKKALNQIIAVSDATERPSEAKEFEVLVEKLLRKDPIPVLKPKSSSNDITKKVSPKSVTLETNTKVIGSTTIVDFSDLRLAQMARISLAGLGGLPWRPKQANQKGIRILSFDGGGTKGVLSLAILDEILKRAGKTTPHEIFDIICGTSTGGIISMLLGVKRQKIADAIFLYDSLIDKIFVKPSRLRLVSEQVKSDTKFIIPL